MRAFCLLGFLDSGLQTLTPHHKSSIVTINMTIKSPNRSEAMPHAENLAMLSRAATSTELHQVYDAWSTFYDELSNGTTRQPPDRLITDSRVLGAPLIGTGVGNELDSAQVWRLNDSNDPGVRVRLSLHSKKARASDAWADHIMLVHASGLASYEITQFRLIKCGATYVTVREKELAKRTPNFDDLLRFDDALWQITAPVNTDLRKQRLATRLASRWFSYQS
jgi:hypothetical protein